MESIDGVMIITNDREAEWALKKYNAEVAERDRLKDLIKFDREELDKREEEVDANFENRTKALKAALALFMESADAKETKTQKSYQLLSGKLVYKKPTVKYEHDEKALLSWLFNNDKDKYVETSAKVKWGEFKKTLVFEDGQAIDPDTGAVIDAITAVEEPAKFEIK